ncbi:MAG: nucleotidyltransferase domain-containing protein [Planctomycetota bacterium]
MRVREAVAVPEQGEARVHGTQCERIGVSRKHALAYNDAMSTINKLDSPKLDLPFDVIADFCRRWKIVKLELFGSGVREDFGPGSDLDFLYTFSDEAHWGWEIVTLGDELSRIVGRPVDLVSRRAVERSPNWVRRNAILGMAQVIYGA